MVLGALDAVCEITSAAGSRLVNIQDMYAGFGKSAIDSTREIISKIVIPGLRPTENSAYIRLELRESLSLPMLNVAAFVAVKKGHFDQVRLAMAPVGVGPVRATACELFLTGKKVSAEIIAESAALSLQNANPRSNLLRGSKAYRIETLPVLVKRALLESVAGLGYSLATTYHR